MSDADSSPEAIAHALRMAAFQLARRLRQHRAVDEMTDAQMAVLGNLRVYGTQSISQLATRERVSSPTMSNTVNGMVEQGYAVRTSDPADLRRVNVDLTERGHQVAVDTARKRTASLARDLRELEFTEAELETLRAASALIRRVVNH